jgi:hypothetical protein
MAILFETVWLKKANTDSTSLILLVELLATFLKKKKKELILF